MSSTRRLVLLSFIAAFLGVAGGGAAYVLIHLIALLTNAALLHRYSWKLPSFAHMHPGWYLIPTAMGGGLLIALMAKWAPVIKGHGIPEAMEAVLTKQSKIKPRTAMAKPLSAAIAIGTGGPFGAEGPIIVTGGAIGSLVGQLLHVSPNERKILLACGAAAGMAATFGAPLASVILAIELLLFEFSTRAFIPLVVASSVAAGMHSQLFGSGPLFKVTHHSFAGLGKLPFYALVGIVCGLLAVVITKGLFAVEHGFRRSRIPEFWHPVVGALGFAIVGMFVPRALGVGYDSIGDVLADKLAVGALATLAIAKLVAWWIALGSGTSGGTLAPILLISGATGALIGTAAHSVVGTIVPGAVALVAMAATFGAATGATFAAIVFLFELTRDYQIVLPLMLASVLADLVARALLKDNIMTEKLTRRGLRVGSSYHADPLEVTTVGDVMTKDVITLQASATVAEARALFTSESHSAYPIVDGSRCVGIIARGDMLREVEAEDESVLDNLAEKDIVTVTVDQPLIDALKVMIEEGIDHVPVVDDEKLVGICTRTDVLHARKRQFESDRLQRGWGGMVFNRSVR
ncbi:MAG: chloride channel protein [Actinomycetota bacterium]